MKHTCIIYHTTHNHNKAIVWHSSILTYDYDDAYLLLKCGMAAAQPIWHVRNMFKCMKHQNSYATNPTTARVTTLPKYRYNVKMQKNTPCNSNIAPWSFICVTHNTQVMCNSAHTGTVFLKKGQSDNDPYKKKEFYDYLDTWAIALYT